MPASPSSRSLASACQSESKDCSCKTYDARSFCVTVKPVHERTTLWYLSWSARSALAIETSAEWGKDVRRQIADMGRDLSEHILVFRD